MIKDTFFLIFLVGLSVSCKHKSALEYNKTGMEIYRDGFEIIGDGSKASDSLVTLILYNLDEAIKTDDKFLLAYTNKLNVLKSLGRNSEAIEVCDKMLAISSNPSIYIQKGILLEKMGNESDSREMYKAALANFDNSKTNLDIAVARFLSGDSTGALEYLQDLIKAKEVGSDSVVVQEYLRIFSTKKRSDVIDIF